MHGEEMRGREAEGKYGGRHKAGKRNGEGEKYKEKERETKVGVNWRVRELNEI